jgi:hypothetical protein
MKTLIKTLSIGWGTFGLVMVGSQLLALSIVAVAITTIFMVK